MVPASIDCFLEVITPLNDGNNWLLNIQAYPLNSSKNVERKLVKSEYNVAASVCEKSLNCPLFLSLCHPDFSSTNFCTLPR